MKKITILIGSFSVLAVFAISFFLLSSKAEKVHPEIGTVMESIYGLGTVTAERVYSAKAGISVVLSKLYVKEGDIVKQGSPLLNFESTPVRAPFSGTVTSVAFQQSEIVPAQVPIVTMMNLDSLYLEVSLEQQSILRVRKGQKAIVSFESLRGEPATGEVDSIFPRANQFIVRIELEKWPEGVLPGMTADTAIQVGKKEKVTLIPLSAIQSGTITRIRDGKKEKISVKLGVVDGTSAEVVSGDLKADDEILVRK